MDKWIRKVSLSLKLDSHFTRAEGTLIDMAACGSISQVRGTESAAQLITTSGWNPNIVYTSKCFHKKQFKFRAITRRQIIHQHFLNKKKKKNWYFTNQHLNECKTTPNSRKMYKRLQFDCRNSNTHEPSKLQALNHQNQKHGRQISHSTVIRNVEIKTCPNAQDIASRPLPVRKSAWKGRAWGMASSSAWGGGEEWCVNARSKGELDPEPSANDCRRCCPK